jgi:N-acetylglutamate synthase-like GNAT family acetyltransferase
MSPACLPDTPQRWTRGRLAVTTDRAAIDLDQAHRLLKTSWWAGEMPREQFERAFRGSVVFAVHEDGQLVGLARVVSDLATYGYLTDVIVSQGARGRGIGRLLMECILAHPELQGFRRMALLTKDTQALYRKFGFGEGPGDSVYMERKG